jgi:hypothetical protein
MRDVIANAINVEGYMAFYVGAYPYFAKMVAVTFLTTWTQGKIMANWKRKAGLKEW